MDRGLKERLVGAAVLVALAVIFIPMLLDDTPPAHEPITETNIPPRPVDDDRFSSRAMPMEALPEPETEPVHQPAETDHAEAPVAEETEAEPAPEETPVAEQPSPDPEPAALVEAMPAPDTETAAVMAWVIQLGSFSNRENAESLGKKLREAGYQAFIEELQQNNKTSYRVRVGPEVMRAEADKLLEQINERFELEGIVVRYP